MTKCPVFTVCEFRAVLLSLAGILSAVALAIVPAVGQEHSLTHESAVLNIDRALTADDRRALAESGVTWSSSVSQQQILVSIPNGSLSTVNDKLLSAGLSANLEVAPAAIKLSGLLNEDGEVPKRYWDANGNVKLIAHAAPGNTDEAVAKGLTDAGFAVSSDPKVSGVIITLPSTEVGRLAGQPFIERVLLAPGFPMLN